MIISRTRFAGLALMAVCSAAWAQIPMTVPPDSAAVDSLYSRIIPNIGSSKLTTPRWMMDREHWQWTDSRSLSQVLERSDGLYLRTQGESGAPVGSSWLGGSSSHDVLTLDALPLSDPLTGRVNFSHIPLEYLEGIERLNSSEALMLGHRWNLVSRQYSNVRPITAIRFMQEPNETILTDASFTQNIARSTNFLFGFLRQTTGGRFANAALNAWSLRSRLRANLAEVLNVTGTWSYERDTRGINGGVDRTQSPNTFDDVTAVVNRQSGYEIYERTDLSLGAVGRFLGDTLSLTRMSVASRRSEREYRRPDLFSATDERNFSRATDVRFSLEQSIALPFVTLRAAGEVGSTHIRASEVFSDRQVKRNRMSASFAGTFSEYLIPQFAIGRSASDGNSAQEMAATIEFLPGAGVSVSAQYQSHPLTPTLLELYWTDSTVLRPTPIRRGDERLSTVSIAWNWAEQIHIELTGFRREQTDAVLARPGITSDGTPAVVVTQYSPVWTGSSSRAFLQLWQFELSGEFTYATVTRIDTIRQLLPMWWGTAEVAFRGRLANDKLGVRVGIRTRFSDRSMGLSPDPATGFEVANTSVRIGRSATLDVYGTMQIGDAFVTLSWENITDAPWLRTAVYPMPDRQFKLGVRWVFAD